MNFEQYVLDTYMASDLPDGLLVGLGTTVLLLCLPYALYLAVSLFNPDLLVISELRLKVALVLVVLLVFGAGLFIGANNQLFVTCGDLRIAGDDQPEQCRPGPPSQF